MKVIRPTYVKRLSSGYWHVRFGPYQFVQFPVGYDATEEDVFGEPKLLLANLANQAITERSLTQ